MAPGRERRASLSKAEQRRMSVSKSKPPVEEPLPIISPQLHAEQVAEVRGRIGQLIDEVLEDPDADILAPVPVAGQTSPTRRGVTAELDTDDVDVYQHVSVHQAAELARSRVDRLLARLQTEERGETLSQVGSWVLDRKVHMARELDNLLRLEGECDLRDEEFEGASQEINDAMKSRETGTSRALREFCSNVRTLTAGRKRLQFEQQGRAHGHYRVPKTRAELEAAIEKAAEEVRTREADAWNLLRELGSERGPWPTNATPQGEMSLTFDEAVRKDSVGRRKSRKNKDVEDELQLALSLMRDNLRQAEERSSILHTIGDFLHKGAGIDDLSSTAESGTARVLKNLMVEVNNNLLPQLLEERQRLHGPELVPPSEDAVTLAQTEVDALGGKLEALLKVLEAFRSSSAFDADIADQLAAVDAGRMPDNFVFQRCLQALGPADWWGDKRSGEVNNDADKFEKDLRLRTIAQEAEVRKLMESRCRENLRIAEEVKQVAMRSGSVHKELDAEEHREGNFRRTLAVLEEHQGLFSSAVHAASGGLYEETHVRHHHAVPRRRASATAAAVAAAKSSRELLDNDLFAENITAEGGVPADVLAAMLEEDRKLEEDCEDIEGKLDTSIRRLEQMCRLGIGGVTQAMLDQVRDRMNVNRLAVAELDVALRALGNLEFLDSALDGATVSYIDRASAVKAAREARRRVPRTALAQPATSGGPEDAADERLAAKAEHDAQDAWSARLGKVLDLQYEAQELGVEIARLGEEATKRRRALPVSAVRAASSLAVPRAGRLQPVPPVRGQEVATLSPQDNDVRTLRQEIRHCSALRAQVRALLRDRKLAAAAAAGDGDMNDFDDAADNGSWEDSSVNRPKATSSSSPSSIGSSSCESLSRPPEGARALH